MSDEQESTDAQVGQPRTGGGPLPVDRFGVPGDVRGSADGYGTIVKTVSEGLASAAKAPGRSETTMMDAVTGVIRSAMRGSMGFGGDISMGAKAIVVGVIRGAGARDDSGLKTLAHAARTVMRQAAEVHGDMGATAKGVVLGAIAGAEAMGVERSKAASTARSAAADEAARIGAAASDAVRDVLKRDIGGLAAPPPEPVQS